MSILNTIKQRIKRRLFPKYGWFGNYATWQEAQQKCTGYDSSLILEKVKDAAIKVKNGTIAYERDGVAFDTIQYSYPLVNLIKKVAAENNQSVKIADFGGSLGSSYFQNREILAPLQQVSWSIIEQANFVKAGVSYLQDDRLKFYFTIDESIATEGTPDILLISSTIQYIEEPYALLKELISKKIKYLIIENTPFNYRSGNRITIQKVPPEIYTASYPCWFLDYTQVKNELSSQYEMLSEYTNELYIYLDHKKIPYRGLIMKLKN
jgi:putative methyltransferase (TIGR04325 family)